MRAHTSKDVPARTDLEEIRIFQEVALGNGKLEALFFRADADMKQAST